MGNATSHLRSIAATSGEEAASGEVIPRVAVVQDGARLHYALPLALQKVGLLNRVFTEWFVTPGSIEALISRAMGCISPDLGRRMQDRACPGLSPSVVRRNPWLVLRQYCGRARFRNDVDFSQWIRHSLRMWVERQGLGDANTVMGFVPPIDPELLAWARRQGVLVVGDQVCAPNRVFMRHCLEELERWPGWERMLSPREIQERYGAWAELEDRSWRELDHISCASDYVRRGLESEGVEPQRISVNPYPIDASAYAVPDRRNRSGPVTVGFVGRVSLLKGAAYFFDVARRLSGSNVKFVMIGAVGLEESVARERKGNVELVGRVPRSEVATWLSKFDIFLFPSVSEGSSGAVMEAMCSALPVVVSSNSGSVARNGVEGFSAAHDDVEALAGYVQRLVEDQKLREEMGDAARKRVETFNLQAYGQTLATMLKKLLSAKLSLRGHR
jgi:glycosyltransferase involved in cell wall biosynthesis